MPTFEKTQLVPVDADELYRWHARPGAFERLIPPWEDIESIDERGGIEDGARRIFKIQQGPVSVTWEAHHRDHIAGEQFVDEQVRGPFARWVHTHRFEQHEPGKSWLVDHVDYALPLGGLGSMMGGSKARRMLEKMFAFRHRRTVEDLMRHADTDRRLTVVISGASGMVGSALSALLSSGGHRVIRLVRRIGDVGEDALYWSPSTGEIDAEGLEGVDAVVHLAGESLQGRWTKKKRQAIEHSRIKGTSLLAEALAGLRDPPEVFATASAVGWYGDTGREPVDEKGAPGEGFLAEVCQKWENASAAAKEAGIRTVNMRLGVVLEPSGGAMAKMLPSVRYGLASQLGSGDQYMSWIDLDDAIGAMLFLLTHDELEGPVNLTAPRPVTNAELHQELGDVLDRPTWIPVPSMAVKAAVGSQAAQEMALVSQRVVPTVLQEAGFHYYYPDLKTSFETKLGISPAVADADRAMSISCLINTGIHGSI